MLRFNSGHASTLTASVVINGSAQTEHLDEHAAWPWGIHMSIEDLIDGNVATATVGACARFIHLTSIQILISFGGVIGKLSIAQLLVMFIIEVPLYAVNFWIGGTLIGAVDVGGSIFIHTFGAVFGLFAARAIFNVCLYED
jgi:ammonium transporter Rh